MPPPPSPWRCVAVSGAGGFIGRRFCELLASRGVVVSGLDVSPMVPAQLPSNKPLVQRRPLSSSASSCSSSSSPESALFSTLSDLPVDLEYFREHVSSTADGLGGGASDAVDCLIGGDADIDTMGLPPGFGREPYPFPFARYVQCDVCDLDAVRRWLSPVRVPAHLRPRSASSSQDGSSGGEELLPVDLVIHCAALVTDNGDWNLFQRINGESGALVARECWQMGIKRFIHLSSVMVYGFNFPDGVSEASDPLHFRGENNPYCQTKIDSERLLRELIQEMQSQQGQQQTGTESQSSGMDIIIIRPGDVIGPGSTWVVPPVHILRTLGSIIVPRGGIINHVFVDNLFDGVMIAADRGANGEAYTITDDGGMLFVDFFKRIARSTVGHENVRAVPYPVIFVLFVIIRVVMALLLWMRLMDAGAQKKLNLTLESLKFLRRPGRYSCDKIRALGYKPRIGIIEAIEVSAAPHR